MGEWRPRIEAKIIIVLMAPILDFTKMMLNVSIFLLEIFFPMRLFRLWGVT